MTHVWWRAALLAGMAGACATLNRGSVNPAGIGVMMAYEVAGRVTSDDLSCGREVQDASIALFDAFGNLLDETRSDANGRFNVAVRNPDAAELMVAKLDQDDPTVQVALRVQVSGYPEQRISLRLPRPVQAREYRVRLVVKQGCD